MDKQYTIGSSHGELTVDAHGAVIDRRLYNSDCDGGAHLSSIVRFDIMEWRNHWDNPESSHIDILDLGYWYAGAECGNEQYAPPDANWRAEIAEILLERRTAVGNGGAV